MKNVPSKSVLKTLDMQPVTWWIDSKKNIKNIIFQTLFLHNKNNLFSPQRGISEVFAGLDHVGILACLVGI